MGYGCDQCWDGKRRAVDCARYTQLRQGASVKGAGGRIRGRSAPAAVYGDSRAEIARRRTGDVRKPVEIRYPAVARCGWRKWRRGP
jgi:hypothetical protein